jgi:DNA-binding CsgD family transcriptional regulator
MSMADQRVALDYAADLARCDDSQELARAFRALPGVVGADALIFGELRRPEAPDAPLIWVADCDDPTVYDEHVIAAGRRYWRQHPVIVRQFQGLIPYPVKVSDFLSQSEWRRRELFEHAHGRMGLPHELTTHFAWAHDRVACVALHRAGRDFSERDRAMLALLTPHLDAARRRVARRERAHEPPAPAALAAALSLTRRQAEVLALLAAGRTDAEIAAELGISRHTIRRHVEGIYERLGVRNRAQATAKALHAGARVTR